MNYEWVKETVEFSNEEIENFMQFWKEGRQVRLVDKELFLSPALCKLQDTKKEHLQYGMFLILDFKVSIKNENPNEGIIVSFWLKGCPK